MLVVMRHMYTVVGVEQNYQELLFNGLAFVLLSRRVKWTAQWQLTIEDANKRNDTNNRVSKADDLLKLA